jgi:GT2 family glycosyltransferase
MKLNTFVFPIVRRDFILDALKSLHLVTPNNYNVICIDQTQPDREFEEKLRWHCDLWIKTRKNYGFAQAVNFGIRLAPTEYVTICNDDVVFVWPDWWQGIMETFERYETAICVNPMSPKEPGWGYGEEGYREHLTLSESVKPENIERLVKERGGQMVDGLVCWCTTFKREKLEKIGLFDERFWPGAGEDYDLMGRIYIAGYRALATSLSWVYHYWGQSKDEKDGLRTALPPAREQWNKLNILWPDGFDVWGRDPETRDWYKRLPEVAQLDL